MDAIDIGLLVAILVLVCFSAFFSATETAYTSFSTVRMRRYAQKRRTARLALRIVLTTSAASLLTLPAWIKTGFWLRFNVCLRKTGSYSGKITLSPAKNTCGSGLRQNRQPDLIHISR